MQQPYSWYPLGEAVPGAFNQFAWSSELAMLDLCGVLYCTVLVLGLAAITPRARVPGLSIAGAGAFAVYFLQGFLVPAVAPLGHRLISSIFRNPEAPPPKASAYHVMVVVLLMSFAYTVGCAWLVARGIAACRGRHSHSRAAAAIGLVLLVELHARVGGGFLSTAVEAQAAPKVAGRHKRCEVDPQELGQCRDCLRAKGGSCAACVGRFNCKCDCAAAGDPTVHIAIVGGSVSAAGALGQDNKTPGYAHYLTTMHNARVSNYAVHGTGSALASFCVDEFLPSEPRADYIVIEFGPDDTLGWPEEGVKASQAEEDAVLSAINPSRRTHVPNSAALGPLASMERLIRQIATTRPHARVLLVYVCGPGNRYSSTHMRRCEGLFSRVSARYGVVEISLRDAFRSAARYQSLFLSLMSGTLPDASGQHAIAAAISEAIERGVPETAVPLPPPKWAIKGWAADKGARSCKLCSKKAGCDALSPESMVGFAAGASPNMIGGARVLKAHRKGARVSFRVMSGRVVMATLCSPLPTAGLLRVTIHQGQCANGGGGKGHPPPAAPGGRLFDLRWSQPVTQQCMVDLGAVCCHGNLTVETLERSPGQIGVAKIFGLLSQPMASERCRT